MPIWLCPSAASPNPCLTAFTDFRYSWATGQTPWVASAKDLHDPCLTPFSRIPTSQPLWPYFSALNPHTLSTTGFLHMLSYVAGMPLSFPFTPPQNLSHTHTFFPWLIQIPAQSSFYPSRLPWPPHPREASRMPQKLLLLGSHHTWNLTLIHDVLINAHLPN